MVTTCRLRPLVDSDLELFERQFATRAGAGEYQWFGFGSPGRDLREMGAIGPEGGRLTVVAGERVIGSVFWFRKEWGPPQTSWCWEVAFHLHEAERGRGLGRQCLALLCDYLFDHTVSWRIQAMVDVENVASRRTVERCGFVREGLLRAPQWREGRFRDHYLYSLLRGDSSSSALILER